MICDGLTEILSLPLFSLFGKSEITLLEGKLSELERELVRLVFTVCLIGVLGETEWILKVTKHEEVILTGFEIPVDQLDLRVVYRFG